MWQNPPFEYIDQPRVLDRKRRTFLAEAVSAVLADPGEAGPAELLATQALAAGADDQTVELKLDRLLVTGEASWPDKKWLRQQLHDILQQLDPETVEYVFDRALRAAQAHARERRFGRWTHANPTVDSTGFLPKEFLKDIWVVGQGGYHSPSVIVAGIFKRKADAMAASQMPGHVPGFLVNWSAGALPKVGQRLEVVREYDPIGRHGEGRPGFYPYFHPHANPEGTTKSRSLGDLAYWTIDGHPACEVLPAGTAPCCGRTKLIERVATEYAKRWSRRRVEVWPGGCPAEGLRRGGR